MIDGMLTIKEFAEQHGKSVQAVYKQIRSKENAIELEGHIITRRVGNHDTKLLDEEAVRVLERASRQDPVVILQTNDKMRISELEQQVETLKGKIFQLQEMIISRDDKILELTDRVLLLTERPQESQPKSDIEPEAEATEPLRQDAESDPDGSAPTVDLSGQTFKQPDEQPLNNEKTAKKWWQFWK